MALEQKLHLKLSQKLIMTPSLQQAIKLLQLSKLELQEVLNQELLENPLLEESAEEAKQEEAEAEAQEKTQTEEEAKAAEPPKEKEKDSFDEIDYDAYFQDYIEYGYNPRGMGEEHEEFPIENTLTRPPNLTDHLTWQLNMSDSSPRVKEIGQFIIGNIDEDGYLRANYVEPDVYVHKVGDEYVIVLNEDGMPKLRINGSYRAMLNSMDSKSDGETVNYIKDKIRSAVWLIKSLDQRQRTIYKVAESIVKDQREFLEKGIDYLRPLVLRDVADDIQMHESTVSPLVANKYNPHPRAQ